MTQSIEIARNPWMEGIVSLPTFLSQIDWKLVTKENDRSNSAHTPIKQIDIKKYKADVTNTKILPSFSSSVAVGSIAKFSSELLLLTPVGMLNDLFALSGNPCVKSYVVHPRPEDDSELRSFEYFFIRISSANRFLRTKS